MVRYLKDAGMSAREIAERLNRSETYVYNLLGVLRNQELVEKVRNEEVSLREAIGLAYKPGADYDRHSVGGEAVSGDISAKEARIEVAKLGKAEVEETRGKEAKIEEILGTITSEMERIYMRRDVMREMEAALDALGVSDISDRD
ncbi:MAG: winged helix-turn-helix domain-containing protein [Nitrososphaerota archaeon]